MRLLIFMISLLLFVGIVNAEMEHYYEVPLKYDKGNISSDEVLVKPLGPGEKIDNLPGGYVAETVDFNDKVLNVTFFSIPLKILYDNVDEETGEIIGGGMITLDEQNISLMLQYFENAKAVNIYDMNITLKHTIEIGHYSKDAPVDAGVEDDVAPGEVSVEEVSETDKAPVSVIPWLVLIVTIVVLALLYKKFYKKKK